jgi:hypothetical protein
LATNVPGIKKSSVYRARPVTLATASTRLTDLPIAMGVSLKEEMPKLPKMR